MKRIISLLVAFVICFSVFPVSASATIGDDVGSFADWLYNFTYPGVQDAVDWFKGKITSDGDSTAYSSYVADVTNVFGSSTLGNNCSYLGNWSVNTSQTTSSAFYNNGTFSSGAYFNWDYTNSASQWYGGYSFVVDSTFIAPLTGDYTFTLYSDSSCTGSSDGSVSFSSMQLLHSSTLYQSATSLGSYTYSLISGETYTIRYWYTVSGHSPFVLNASGACRLEYPTDGLTTTAGDLDVSSDTRAGSLTGDLMYVGDDGTQVAADDVTLFDESTGTVYNPSTNDSYNTTDWNYDYSDRSYHFTTDDSHTGKVVYGDDNASVTLTDSDGNTITYNYYYTVSGSSGSSSSGTSIWSKLGDLLGTVVDGFISLVSTALSHLLDSLISLLEMVNGKLTTVLDTVFSLFDHIPSLFNGFTAFLAAVFPFIPQEIWDVLELGVCLLAAAAIIRFFLKR